MRILLTLLLSLTISLTYAQNFIDSNFGQYEDLDETTVVHVSGKTFEYAAYVIPENDEEEIELKEFVASVRSLDLIAVDDLEEAGSEYQRGIRALERNYDELMNIKEDGNRVSIFIDADDEYVYELVGIGYDDNDFFVASVTGEMKLDVIANIISNMDSEEMAPLAQMKNYDINAFEIYPNPVNGATTLTIEIPEGMIGGKGTVYDLTGAIVERFSISNRSQKLNTNTLEPGTYIIGLEKEDVSMKKQVVVVR